MFTFEQPIFITMSVQLYNPIGNLIFDEKTCFLTGADLTKEDEYVTVFPNWVLDNYELRGKKFTMMDNYNAIYYEDLKLPCSEEVKKALNDLEQKIQTAFEKGYEGVTALDSQLLFLWMGKIIYGILFHDLLIEKKKKEKRNLEFGISDLLKERFSLFHIMLQSLIAPITFSALKPWSIAIVPLQYSKEVFNYKGDAINLFFTLGTNGFGIIALLQDNDFIKQRENELLQKIGTTVLHPIQFEELNARFAYSNYLLLHKRRYKLKETENSLAIETIPYESENNQPALGVWDNNLFADVLTEYWKPWGLQKNDIHAYPNAPISFLENEYTYELIDPLTIELPF
ncbi:MAG: hypothetical protein RJA25_173 [Bacteroidota bacterium]|jgi:hypothetical protein